MAEDRWPHTRASIIQRLGDPADEEAWNLAIEIYSPPVLQYCRSRGLQKQDALDVAQEVLSKLQSFEYRPERGKFRAWLGTVTRNQVNLFWRKQAKNIQPVEMPELSGSDDLDWERISNAHILDAALDRIRPEFDEHQWRAFREVALDVRHEGDKREFVWNSEKPAGEVAKQFGRPVAWVYKTKSEIMKRLRDEVLFIAEELTVIDR